MDNYFYGHINWPQLKAKEKSCLKYNIIARANFTSKGPYLTFSTFIIKFCISSQGKEISLQSSYPDKEGSFNI